MPRVLRIINRFNLGGPTHNAAYLTRYLPGDFETLLVGGAQEQSEEGSGHILKNMGVEPMILPEMQREVAPWRDRSAYRRIKQLIKEFKPDIVHTHAAKAGAVGRMAASELGVKAIVHTFHGHVFHSYFGAVRTAMYKNIERFLARRSSRIVAISDKQKSELVDEHRICADDKVSVIPLGFDLGKFQQDQAAKRALFRRVYGVADDEIAIGIVGRLVPVKNHDLFLEAMKQVRERTGRKVRAFIVGDGEERERLETRTRELGLSQVSGPYFNGHGFGHGLNGHPMTERADITWTSWIKEIDIVNAGVDLVALTSVNEGTPVSLIEAQAANRPIVSTKVGGIENVVVEGGTALLSPTEDVGRFTENLLRLVEDDGLRARMSHGGWEHVKQRYHYTRLVDDTAALYRELLAEAPVAVHYIRPKFSGMVKCWSLLIVVCALVAGCNINRDIMFKTPLDYDFDQLPDSVPQVFRVQVNDIITFRLFANDGFRMIDLVDEGTQNQRNNRTTFNYTVDADGRAKLPLLGSFPLAGLTIREAELALETRYTEFYNRPFVQLFINNRRVVVFPGGGGDAKIVPLENTNTTLMEALASAGGLNKRGDARKVKVFRKVPNGPRQVFIFNMSDVDGLPFADLTMQADDIVYVQPNPELARELLADLNPFIALLTSTVLVIGIVRGFSQ